MKPTANSEKSVNVTVTPELENLCVNTIRMLSADAVQKANSGHPGLPMGAAPIGYVLFSRIMKFNPQNPKWFNRDRFVLSAGHGSALYYSLLHLTGYPEMTMDEIKSFRQWGSKTPGHPESHLTSGIEVTTGPLGQGIANAVGLAMAEAHLAARFNKPDVKVVDHYTYVLMGDGCHQEGVSGEACSLAGHLGLGKLIAIYDENRISIDGSCDLSFTEDVGARFAAYGWDVQTVADGNTDIDGIAAAIERAKQVTDKPTLIRVRTAIGYGSPKFQGSASCHGSPLGADELKATRENLGYTLPPFEIDPAVYEHMGKAVDKGRASESAWQDTLKAYRAKYPTEAATFEQLISGELPAGWDKALPVYKVGDKEKASRVYSGECLNALAETVVGLVGGSADLAPSNNTLLKSSGDFLKNGYENRNLRFGVREHGMAAVCTGIALHGSGLIPYCATFMVFSDYMRGAMRVAALSGAGTIYVLTHDSIAVGEDGPTHQPVEHLAALRSIPNLTVLRPADGKETSGAYYAAISNRKGPTVLALTRQNLPHMDNTSVEGVQKGAYTVLSGGDKPALILIGTGSELHLCVEAGKKLNAEGIATRVVSMPSTDLFLAQDEAYRESVLPKGVKKRLAVEAGVSLGWHRFVGDEGDAICIDQFGVSAPGNLCMSHFGFTVDNVYARAKALLG